jgi:hypothetical protein
MQNKAYPWHGAIIHEGDMPGYSVSYRFHGPDPVRFSERIRVSIEHGHANHLADDWATTAYWYQLPPARPVTLQPLADRLPTRPVQDVESEVHEPPTELADDVRAARADSAERERQNRERHAQRTLERRERAEREEAANREHARGLRRRFG